MTIQQEQLFELLQEFSKICEDHKLRYFLVGGTLLGAVRHKGFIPWDDDIDVAMPEEDYWRFLSLQEFLPDGLVILTEQTSHRYPFYFSELCNMRVPFISENPSGPAGIYIDIFPIVPSCKPDGKAEFCFNIISVIGYVLQLKTGWTSYKPYKKAYARLCFLLLKKCSIAQLRSLRAWLVKKLEQESTDYCFSPGGGHKGLVEFYPKHWFDAAQFFYFEEKQFPVPIGWDGYLHQLYGEYMILPAICDRESHHKR